MVQHVQVPLCRIHWDRGVSCYDEHISRMEDPVVGCYARDSDHVVLPADYTLYNRFVNTADVPTLTAFVDTPTTMLPTADSSDSDGYGKCGGELTAEASTTKKRSAPSIWLEQRRVATRSQEVTELRRSARRGKGL
jgi:hypothetical protein